MLNQVNSSELVTPSVVEKKKRFRVETFITIASIPLIIAPVIFLFVVIASYARNVLYIDEWWFSYFVVKLHTSGYTLAELWEPHNEHRFFFSRIAMLILAGLGGWDILKEIYFNIVCTIGILILLGLMLKRTVQSRFNWLALGVISALLFGITQFVSWLHGLMLVWFIANLFTIASVWFMSKYRLSWQTISLGGLCAVVACYSNSSGLVGLPAIMVCLILRYKSVGWKPIVSWLLICTAILSIHVPGMYAPNFKRPDYTLLFTYPDRFIENVFGLMWNVFVVGDTLTQPLKFTLSIGSLILLVACFGYLAWRSFKLGGEEGSRLWWSTVSWLMITLYGVGNIVLISVARLGYTDGQAYNASWYITVSLYYWVGTTVIIFLAGRDLFLRLHSNKVKWLPVTVMSLLLLMFTTLTVISSSKMLHSYSQWAMLGDQIVTGMIYDYRKVPLPLYRRYLNTTYERFMDFLGTLDTYDEYIFHPSVETETKKKLANWQQNLVTKQNFLYTYPPDLFQTTFNVENKQVNGSTITFTPSLNIPDRYPIFTIKNAEFELKQGTFNKKRVLDFQVSNAYYLRVYWETGNGFSENYVMILAPVYEKDGKKHFRLPVPEGTQQLRVDFYYKQGEPLQTTDSLQVDVYQE
jgi:hypothetical protein